MKRLMYICLWMLSSLSTIHVYSQEAEQGRVKPSKVDATEFVETEKPEKEFVNRDLRIGIDISTIISGAITPIRRGIDLSLEYTLTPNIFLMLEGGNQYYEKENARVHYISKGNYIRLGIDYNLRKPVEKNDHDIYYIGGRLAYSKFEQEIPFYLLTNGYWGNTTSSIRPYNGYAYWFEFVTGFKVEVLKNWYLGMGARLKFFISRSKTKIEPVGFVPGYARNYNTSVFDFNYTIYYNIPLNYKKTKQAVHE